MTSTSEPVFISQPAPVIPSGVPVRLSWGALFGALFLTLGIFALLASAGFAVGLSSVRPGNLDSVRSTMSGVAIWSGVSFVVALFIGGITASRTAGIVDRATGAIHGAVLWGLKISMLGFAMYIGSSLNSIASAAAGATGEGMSDGDAIMALHTARAGTTMWWLFFALAIGLAAAVLGATLGVSARQRRAAAALLVPRTPVVEVPAHAGSW
jgi:hypothetical protein